jgi:transposase
MYYLCAQTIHFIYIMPKPLSDDLRKRIIDSKLRGDTEDKIASEKEVSKSTVTKLWSKFRSTGNYSPRSGRSGRKPGLSDHQLEQVGQAIVERPDITFRELIDKFFFPVSVSALSRTVRNKLGFRFKKNITCRLTTA